MPITRRGVERMADCDRGCVIRIPSQTHSIEVQQRDNTHPFPVVRASVTQYRALGYWLLHHQFLILIAPALLSGI